MRKYDIQSDLNEKVRSILLTAIFVVYIKKISPRVLGALHMEHSSGHTGLTTDNKVLQTFCMTHCHLLQFLRESERTHTVNHTNVHPSLFLSFNLTITFYDLFYKNHPS